MKSYKGENVSHIQTIKLCATVFRAATAARAIEDYGPKFWAPTEIASWPRL